MEAAIRTRFRSTLRVEPPGQPPLDLVLSDGAARLDVLPPALYTLQDVEVVLDVLQRGLVRKSVEDLPSIPLCGR